MNNFIKTFKLLLHNFIYFLILAIGYDLNILYKNYGFSLYQPCSSIDMKKEVCEGQANILMGYLNQYNDPKNTQKFDDFWKFEYQSKPGHFWAVGVSSNPKDPPIFLDPWKEHFSIFSYCPDCNSIENFIYPFFYTSIPSKPNIGILK